MPTDKPTTPDPGRPGEPLPTRELLLRTIIRIRGDLRRVERLAEVLGVNEPTPPEVTAAIATLDRWSRRLVKAGRPRRPKP